jgi:hypothetical protein
MRAAVLQNPGGLIYFSDRETGKTFFLVEQGALPELEEEYIRDGLEVARPRRDFHNIDR